jgi:DNA polymerase-3 subunit gamma/tau
MALGNGKLSAEAVSALLGGGGRAEMERFASLLRSSPADASQELKELLGRGVSPERFLDALFPLFRDMWVYSLWGEASFAGLSLSEEEKKFLASEAPGWDSGTLAALVSFCASLFPRARQGLRSDVFAGLLMFGLLGAMNAEGGDRRARPAAGMIPEAAPALTPRAPAAAIPKKAPPILREAIPEPPRDQEPVLASSGSPSDSWGGLFASLWKSDLSLCAAIIDASLFAKDGELIIDSSQASPVSRALLESSRAKAALERAFGLKGESAGQQPPDDDAPARNGRQAARAGDMSIEELSSFLGADLLMAKPKSGIDLMDSDGDIESHEA